MIEALAALGIQVVDGNIDFPEHLECPRIVVYQGVRLPSEYMLDGQPNHLAGTSQIVVCGDTARACRYWGELIPAYLPKSCKVIGAGTAIEDRSNPAQVEWSVTLDVSERN